jgi:hypothetical protein
MIRFATVASSLILALATFAGCAAGGLKSIPGEAMLVQQGTGKFGFTATEDGDLYIRDQAADRILYQGRINRGQRLEIDPPASQITLDGQRVKSLGLRPDATYQIFIKTGAMREYHPMMNP